MPRSTFTYVTKKTEIQRALGQDSRCPCCRLKIILTQDFPMGVCPSVAWECDTTHVTCSCNNYTHVAHWCINFAIMHYTWSYSQCQYSRKVGQPHATPKFSSKLRANTWAFFCHPYPFQPTAVCQQYRIKCHKDSLHTVSLEIVSSTFRR